ncbi:hypothetical protein P421_08705 [Heyndrickxia coagulans P38]|uniref:hypothetical protein n=1 Tax=Heyndrickxia coagulans TaxID=1398 RepID=UPI00054E532C|nr:hypothetical protein [Heyndrickxia coagulans]KGT38664.1 hypothetical protein P421_08705 [Heyndrickxia coagulans P38]KYC60308.1 hypothetical protein B4100_0656 [Heyndrickxia coagulans]
MENRKGEQTDEEVDIAAVLIVAAIGGGPLFYVKSKADRADASTKTVQTATVEKGMAVPSIFRHSFPAASSR